MPDTSKMLKSFQNFLLIALVNIFYNAIFIFLRVILFAGEIVFYKAKNNISVISCMQDTCKPGSRGQTACLCPKLEGEPFSYGAFFTSIGKVFQYFCTILVIEISNCSHNLGRSN